jgi:hypothetical protein
MAIPMQQANKRAPMSQNIGPKIALSKKVSLGQSVTSSGMVSGIGPSISSGDRSILQIPRNSNTLNRLKLKGYANNSNKTKN